MAELRPDGYAWVIPFLSVADPERALSFYESALGFERTNLNEQDGRILHAELRYRGRIVAMLKPAGMHGGEEGGSPVARGRASYVEILVYVEDVDGCHARAIAGGGTSLGEPKDWPWGERIGHVRDPDGYRWLLVENLAGE